MPPLRNLIGQQFGKLIVTALAKERGADGGARWICLCDCGKETVVNRGNLIANTASCGCIRNTQGSLTRRHPLWRRWSNMHERCKNKKKFPHYGGRGIAVCARWNSFRNFLADMESTFFNGASIDRINNDGNYEPDNCRWATAQQQIVNRRCSVIIDTPWGQMNVADAANKMSPGSRVWNRDGRGSM